MPVSVEKDVVITVRGTEPGSDCPKLLELREADGLGSVSISAPKFGVEVPIRDLREALDAADREFTPPLRAV